MMTMRSTLCGVVMFALGAQCAAWAEEPEKSQEYSVKQSKPILGTYLKRDIVMAGFIPLDKKYNELSTEQQDKLKSSYEHMGARDEPPFPVDGLLPAYTATAAAHEKAELKYKGELTLYVQVDREGKAKSVSVVESPDPDITKDVGMFLMLQKYKPALCNGSPCEQVFPFHARLIGPAITDMTSSNPAANNALFTPHN